ncbi:MAG: hypothetical protein A3G38_01065 [Omnitrophica WOR_2 bacterium RIFCSPLOWO2_12_FULL_51_8]|nr:MAG: hypothetical protein A3G38_01065 [Omnitrophica WOR_2 bacterium RIFCSPLOWO2_12_FULL_51_8]
MAKRGLLLKTSLLALFFLSGCFSYTQPTYLKENIPAGIEEICRSEYKFHVKSKLSGATLWIYVPLEDIVVKPDKPEKVTERFLVEKNLSHLQDGILKADYLVRAVPEKIKYQQAGYDPQAAEKINQLYRVLMRVLTSMEKLRAQELQLVCVVTADINNGFQITETFSYEDFKKYFHGFISQGEFQHRLLQETQVAPEIIGDREGLHINYRDVSFSEFITGQIQNRINLKFQKPEVEKDADIDKEVLKIIAYTLKIYNFRDFQEVELNNLAKKKRIILNRAAALEEPLER